MYNFDYHKATSLAEAAKLLKGASDGKLLAGGMTLIPTLKQRLANPSDLIDLNAIPDLRGISVSGNTVTVKAMTVHADVETSAAVKKAIPALAVLAGHIGDPSVRHRGTIGGSIANADPAADYPAGIVGLNATVETNERKIAADDFFKGLFETALHPGEIITAVHFAVPDKAGYMKFAHPASGFAVTAVMVAKFGASRARRRDRRRPLGVPRAGDGSGAGQKLHAGRRGQHQGRPGRSDVGHPRQRRIPRPPRHRHGQARGRRRLGLNDNRHRRQSLKRRGCHPAPRLFCPARQFNR